MNKWLILAMISVWVAGAEVHAAPREANKDSAAILKLQAMVKTLTDERDGAKAETAKLVTDLELLKKDKAASDQAQAQLSSELAAQKSNAEQVRARLDETHARLLEVIEKHKQVSANKAELEETLSAEKNNFTQLSSKQKATEVQLATCGEHNVKLIKAAHELLDRYEHKGTWATLFKEEPVLQFKSVEMENIVQDYQDKINAGTYKATAND